MNVIEILDPRYKDNVVLVATYKVKSGYNYIRFTHAKHLLGKLYRFHATEINTNNVQSNGKIPCFVIPMEKLELVEEIEDKKSTTHNYKLEIDGKSKEYTDPQKLISDLSRFLTREGIN